MNITVIIPTYRRPKDLENCLNALKQQIRAADEIIVTVRDIDSETWEFLNSYNCTPLPLHVATVNRTGVVAAMNIGLETSHGDIVAFTDDDAAPHADWLKRIEAYYLVDEKIGGVGGRDWMYQGGTQLITGEKETVGRLQWFGRVIGNHHLGVGEPRGVDVLKGVNMSFRRAAIGRLRFDERMRGTGAQVHFEIAFSLTLKRQGWKLIYDPAVVVDHYPAQRFDEDQRHAFNAIAWANKAHNETVGLLDHLSSPRQIIYLAWAFLVGTRDVLGFVQLCRFLPVEKDLAFLKWLASIQGRWQGIQTWMQPLPQSEGQDTSC